VFGIKASGSSIEYEKRRSKPMANTTKKRKKNKHQNDSKMCKAKPVLSKAWAELSPPQRKGGFKLDKAKIRAKGKA